LPSHIGANLEIRYATETDVSREGLIGVLDLNKVVDAVLRTVYEAARTGISETQQRSRRVIFSSFDATVSGLYQLVLAFRQSDIIVQLCGHIQLKQPNFAVFYSSHCNVGRVESLDLVQAAPDEESLSVREAVKLAKSQNMLGVALDCRVLVSLLAHVTQNGSR
jgi:CDK inhibitor PHO81